MVSIRTNSGAMQALQILNGATRDLSETQKRISTGLAVGGAKDNASVYAIAQNLRAETGSYQAITSGLNRAKSIVDVSSAAAATISDLLIEIREKAVALADVSLDTVSRTALMNDVNALIRQIDQTATNATFDGVNLLTPEFEPAIVYPKGGGYSQTINDTTTLDGRPGVVTYSFALRNTLSSAFAYTDSDGNGLTSQAELQSYYGQFGQTAVQANAFLARADIDGSVSLTAQEKNLYRSAPTFGSMDADVNGTLDAAEVEARITALGGTTGQAASIFAQMDADADSMITATERNAYYSHTGAPNTTINMHTDVAYTDGGLREETGYWSSTGIAHVQAQFPYGDHVNFLVHPPSDVTFETSVSPSWPALPGWAYGGMGVELQSVSFQPIVGKTQVLASPEGDKIDLTKLPMNAQWFGLTNIEALSPAGLISRVDAAMATATRFEGYFGVQANLLEGMLTHNTRLIDSLNGGIGNLVDADMAKESASLQARQVRQTLATQTLGIANQQPNWILRLFGQ